MKAEAFSPSKLWHWISKPKRVELLVACISLGLIGVGSWLIYPPAGFISVGLLLWIDLSFGGNRK
jgi:hypothetical protein